MGKIDLVWGIVGAICLTIILGLVVNFSQDAWKSNQHVRAVWWGFSAWVVAGLGLLAVAIPLAYKADTETPKATEDPTVKSVRELLERQNAAQMRPYLSVSVVELSDFKVGSRFTVVVRIQNDGRTPAEDVKAFSKLDVADIGAFVDRRYEGLDVDGSKTQIGIGKAIELVLYGPPKLSETMLQGLQSGLKQMVAHGRVTYGSQYIADDGRDELRFCHQFDPETGGLVACRPLLSATDEKAKKGQTR